jgi:hypothetical protein
MRLSPIMLSLTMLAACEKNSSDGSITPPKDPATASSPVASVSAVPAPTPTEPPSAVVATATPSSTAAGSAAPANSAATGKGREGGAGGPSTAALKPVSKRVNGNNFALDVASPGCKAGEECAMTIKLAVSGAYHVNKEYPYKFIATPASGVAFLGKSEPNTFTRAAGDFVEQGEKAALMTVRFKPASAGEAKVAGKYKLSVCSADQCLIEEPMIDLAVPVM